MRLVLLLSVLGICACASGVGPRRPPPRAAATDENFGAFARDPVWVELDRERLRVGGAALRLVHLSWPGNGGALIVEKGTRQLGSYQYVFGGLGGDVRVAG